MYLYVDLICKEMIPEISSKSLAEFCDVFYEEGYFDKEDDALAFFDEIRFILCQKNIFNYESNSK